MKALVSLSIHVSRAHSRRRWFAHRAHHLPINSPINSGTQRADGSFIHGSIRQRSIGSSELRVFTGTDPASGKRCYRSKTVRGSRAEAERELVAMVEIVGRGPSLASKTMVGDLLEQWFTVASANWSPTTIRQTRSVLNRQLHPHLDTVVVSDLTTARIDSRDSLTRECDVGDIPRHLDGGKYVCRPMCRRGSPAHTHRMFHSFQLITTLRTDRQARFGDAATRQRLVRRNQLSPARGPSTAVVSVACPTTSIAW